MNLTVTAINGAAKSGTGSNILQRIQALQKQEMQLFKQLSTLQKQFAGQTPDQASFNLMSALSKEIAAIEQEIKQLQEAMLQQKSDQIQKTSAPQNKEQLQRNAVAPSTSATPLGNPVSTTVTAPSTAVGSVIDTTA